MPRKKLPRGFIYARVGVRIFDHPELAEAGWPGVLLHVRAITYSREHLTDGRVPRAEVRRWLRQLADEFGGFDATPSVEALLRRGVWTDDEVAFYVADYSDYQETRAEVEEQSEQGKSAAAMRYAKPKDASRMPDACDTHAQTETEGERELSPNGDNHGAPDLVDSVWSAYQEHHPTAKMTTNRRDLIRRRLKEHPVDVLVAAVHGNHRSPFHCGENRDGKKYHALELILRDADKIEGFAELATESPLERMARKTNLTSRDMRQLAEVLDQEGGTHDHIGSGADRGQIAGFLPAVDDAA